MCSIVHEASVPVRGKRGQETQLCGPPAACMNNTDKFTAFKENEISRYRGSSLLMWDIFPADGAVKMQDGVLPLFRRTCPHPQGEFSNNEILNLHPQTGSHQVPL
ncbi:hypothetical protein L798_11992 [Zootermopsis nevadensis]|uniref:Uncharacterized protein n=1 Tax=Zootermopsis nevadensis TaxID=136037 RepID=A0A067R3J2_ZOONE|nr:hypothetical protein L798_11992 [Zootermopsis nevadensis]